MAGIYQNEPGAVAMIKKFGIAILVAAALCGCAVLTVDVDVYTGPLANEESVQLEQVMVMAQAAKPLLTTLRNSLETTNVEYLQRQKWYDDGFVRKPSDFTESGKWFHSESAQIVNAILSLYDDTGDSLMMELSRRAEPLLATYQTGWKLLNVDKVHADLDKLLANRLSAFNKNKTPFAEIRVAISNFIAEDGTSSIKMPTAIFDAIERSSDKSTALEAIQNRLKLEKVSFGDVKSETPEKFAKSASTNLKFSLLTEPVIATNLAALIIGDPKEKGALNKNATLREETANRLMEIGRAFRMCRESLDQLYELGLEALIEAKRSASARDIQRGAADFVGILTSPKRLLLAKYVFSEDECDCEKVWQAFECHIEERWKSTQNQGDLWGSLPFWDAENSANNDLVAKALSDALLDNPVEFSYDLRNLHERIKRGITLADFAKLPPPFDSSDTWKLMLSKDELIYGFPHGPVHLGADLKVNEQMEPTLIAATVRRFASGALGLDQGREPCGISSSYLQYMEALNTSAGQTNASVDFHRDRVLRELVQFAEKLLFIANNSTLLKNARARELSPLLQATGNSILIQISELRARQKQGQQMVAGKSMEMDAQRVLRQTNSFLKLMDTISNGETKAPENLKELSDKVDAATKDLEQKTTAETNAKSVRAAAEKDDQEKDARLKAWLAFEKFETTELPAALGTQNITEADALKNWNDKITRKLNGSNGDSDLLNHQKLIAELQKNAPTAAKAPNLIADDIKDRASAIRGQAASESIVAKQMAEKAVKDQKASTIAKVKSEGVLRDARKNKSEASAQALKAQAYSEIRQQIPAVFEKLSSLGKQKSSETAFHILSASLKDLQEKEKDDARKSALGEALKVVSGWDQQLATVANPEAPTRLAVVDQLITELQYQRIDAIRRLGNDAPGVRRIEEAIEAVNNYRSGLIYIRPASAYLRTSSPVTSMRDAARPGWKNELSKQARRQLPFASSLAENNPKNIQAIAEVDKQYWNSVNRIRVAGGGDVNYVLAKDDLGNWSVKHFSADPRQAINSLKNVAMFSLGPTLGGSVPLSGAGRSAQNSPTTLLSQQFARINTAYGNETAELYESLRTNGIPSQIKDEILAAWGESADAKAKTALDNNQKFLKELPTERSTSKQAKLIQDYADGLANFGVTLEAALTNASPALDAKYKTASNQKVGARLKAIIKARTDSLGKYETSLDVVQKSVTDPVDPSPAEGTSATKTPIQAVKALGGAPVSP